jgi:cobalt-zinc-cadmium efflux system membrane fusion protein
VIHHPQLAQVNEQPQLPKYDTLRAISLITRPENNSRNTLHTNRVQFASEDTVTKSGIDVDVVQERPMVDAILANGELLFDPTRVGHLSSRAPGTVAAVFQTVGDRVSAGEILALVDASQVGQAKSQLNQAIVELRLRRNTVERLRPLASSGAVPRKSIIEAGAALEEAEVKLISARQSLVNLGFEIAAELEAKSPQALADELRFLDIPPALIGSFSSGARTANLIPIRAPYSGVLVHSEVVAGEVVDTLILNVRQEDAKYVRQGLPVRFQSDHADQNVGGQVSWISPAVDEPTRTLKVRVALTNEDGRLRDRMFGTGRIILREEPHAIVVPREAVQSIVDESFVFVRDKNYFQEGTPKFFHVRQVRLGARDDQYVELLAGVLPGEVVASKGSNVLLAQLLRSNLGAGCGCHEH